MGTPLAITNLAFGALFGQLAPPAVQMLRATLLRPYVLGAGVRAAWSVARDTALAGLGCVLAYGAVRAMLSGGRPWDAVARAALAAAAAQFSLAIAEWLLAANNALVTALAGPAGSGVDRALILPLGAMVAAGVDLVPSVIGLVVAVGALWIGLTYFLRAAEIVFLALLAPFAAVVWIVPAGEGAWRAVLAELIPAVFQQAGQALVIWAFVAVAAPQGAPPRLAELFTALAALLLLSRVRGVLRGLCRAPAAPSVGGAAPWVLLTRFVPSLGAARRLVGGG